MPDGPPPVTLETTVLDMGLILVTSILIRFGALAWSLVLLRRLRDWRMAFLSTMLALMGLRQVLTLAQSADGAPALAEQTAELPGLAVSVLALLAVIFLERMMAQQRRTMDELGTSEGRYRAYIDHAPTGVFVVDSRGRCVEVNGEAARLTGHTTGELLSMSFDELITSEPGMQEHAGAAFAELIREGAVTSEITIRRGDGRERALELRAVRLAPDRYIGFCTDVTERREAEYERQALEAQLRQAQKMEALGVLAGGLAHDLNNILHSIFGFSELAKSALPADSVERGYLEDVSVSAQRAARLVERVLTFSRRTEPRLEVLDLAPVVADGVELLRASLPATIDVRARLVGGVAFVEADSSQLLQVLLNLGTNAAHAIGDEPGRLTITLEHVELDALPPTAVGQLAPGPHVRLSVSDDGVGMDQATLERIFDPFFTTKAVGQGTGLGLAVVHGIVTGHGGAVRVASAPGAGTTFDIYLPVTGARPGHAVGLPASRPGHGRVLLVDDEEALVRLGRRQLEGLGYCVTAAADSDEALRRFRDAPQEFDVVVTDQTMPHVSGLELARAVHAVRPGLPVVLTTGFSDAVTPETTRAAGVSRVLAKPYGGRELADAVQEALGSS